MSQGLAIGAGKTAASLPDNPLRDLTPDQRAWALESERLWRRAHEISKRHPDSAADAGGFWIPAFGMQPPGIGGNGLERIDVALTAHGLADFEFEYAQAPQCLIDDVPVRILPLDRIIASKRSTNRPKDLAALSALEATIRARADSDREH